MFLQEKIYTSHLLLAAIFIIFPFFISCNAQITAQPLLEPAKGSPVVMNCSPGNITAADLDKDGRPDLVVTCAQSRSIAFFKNNGNGRFDKMPGSPLQLPMPPHEIAIGDMDGDGHADIVVATHDSYTVRILRGDGSGKFSISPDPVVMKNGNHPHTHGLGLGDMNGDGFVDIVTANNEDNDVAVAFNNGSGSFMPAPGSPFPVAPSPYPLTIGDVNKDGHLDIVSTSTRSSSRNLTLLLGDGRGNFRSTNVPLRTASPWYVAIGDINKDGIPDLVVTHSERNELTVLTGTGNGQFTEVSGSPFNLGSSAWHVAIADLNGDADPDVLAAANNGVRVLLGDGTGQFAAAPGSPFATGRGTWHLAVVDVNGDGKVDVVTSNLESNSVSVLVGR